MEMVRDVGRRVVPAARTGPGWVATVALATCLCSYVGLRLFFVEAANTSVWYPATALTCAVAVRWPDRRRATVVGALVGTALAGALYGWPVAVWTGYGLANGAEVWVFAALHRALHGGRRELQRASDVARVAVAALGAVTTGALVFTVPYLVVTLLTDPASSSAAVQAALGYGASHLTGLLVLGPALLTVRVGDTPPARHVEGAAQLATTLAVSAIVFSPGQDVPLAFLTVLPLLWAAGRLGMTRTAVSIAAGGTVVATATAAQGGPFLPAAGLLEGIAATQFLLIANGMGSLTLALMARERDALTAAVTATEARYRRTFDHALLGLGLVRLQAESSRLELANPALREMFEGDDGPAWWARVQDDDRERAQQALEDLAAGRRETWQGQLQVNGRTGHALWFDVRLATLPDEAARSTGLDPHPGAVLLVAQVVDVTERHRTEERLRELALHDGLTGLPNRTLILDRVELALHARLREGGEVAVMFCDLDDFKNVNDSAGHASGDALLVEVAHRISAAVRPGDTVGRLGGDEFVVVCPGVRDEQTALQIAERVLTGVAEPGGTMPMATSVGLVVSQPGSEPEGLLREADTAMYAAKRGGKNRVAVFDAADHHRALRRVRLERELADAVQQDQFVLHYQPVVEIGTGRIGAVEALVRWEHPERGLLLPGDWLDVAEASPVMPRLDVWILRTAVARAAAWSEEFGTAAPVVHVNVSPAQLVRDRFDHEVTELLEEFALPGELLVLEMTEQQLGQPTEVVLRGLDRLRKRGVRLAVDDFGTGYSSLTHLTQLPVDVVKLDRRFVQRMHEDPRSLAVVQAVIGLGSALGLVTVAEGVETPEQAEQLSGLGCTVAQGFLWSRAVPAGTLDPTARLKRGGPDPRRGIAPARGRRRGTRTTSVQGRVLGEGGDQRQVPPLPTQDRVPKPSR